MENTRGMRLMEGGVQGAERMECRAPEAASGFGLSRGWKEKKRGREERRGQAGKVQEMTQGCVCV